MSLLQYSINKCGKNVTFEDRNMEIINGVSKEVFDNPRVRKVIVKTLNGVSVFDETNTERVATHRITMPFESGIGSEQWIKLGTKRLKILPVENCAENDTGLILMCTERGEDSKVVNQG